MMCLPRSNGTSLIGGLKKTVWVSRKDAKLAEAQSALGFVAFLLRLCVRFLLRRKKNHTGI